MNVLLCMALGLAAAAPSASVGAADAGLSPAPWLYPFTVETDRAAAFRRDDVLAETRILIDPVSMGAQEASLLLATSTGNLEIWPHRHVGAELAIVLAGKAKVRGASRQWTELGVGDAVYLGGQVPHGWFWVGTPSQPTRLLLLYAPPGPERSFKDKDAHGASTPVPAGELRHPDPRSPAPRIKRASEVTEQPNALGSGGFRSYFGKEGAASLTLLRGAPGFRISEHVHVDQAELVYVTLGHGELSIDGQRLEVRPGTAVHIPPGHRHAFKVLGVEPFEAVQFYAPGAGQ